MTKEIFDEIAEEFFNEYHLKCINFLENYKTIHIKIEDFEYKLMLIPKTKKENKYYDILPDFYISYIGTDLPMRYDKEMLLRKYVMILKKYNNALNQHFPKSEAIQQVVSSNNIVEENLFVKGDKFSRKECRVFLTLKCNQSCLFCCVKDNRVNVSFEEIKNKLKELSERNRDNLENITITLTGGEPTISPQFLDAIKYIKSLKFPHIILQTNGVMLSDKKLVEEIYNMGIDDILFSFHSHKEEVYNKLTQTTGQYHKALKAIENVLSYPFWMVGFNMVLTKYNYEDIFSHVEFISNLKKCDTTHIYFAPSIINMERDNGNWREITVSYTEILPHLIKSVRYNDDIFGKWSGDCFFPVCIGKDYPEILSHAPVAKISQNTLYIKQDEVSKVTEGTRIKRDDCKLCRYDSMCGGVCSQYAKTYGLNELCPL